MRGGPHFTDGDVSGANQVGEVLFHPRRGGQIAGIGGRAILVNAHRDRDILACVDDVVGDA